MAGKKKVIKCILHETKYLFIRLHYDSEMEVLEQWAIRGHMRNLSYAGGPKLKNYCI